MAISVVSFSFNQSSSPSFVRDSFNSTGKVQEKDLAMEDTSLEDNQSVPCKNVFGMAVGLSSKPKENHEKLLITNLLEGSRGFGYHDKEEDCTLEKEVGPTSSPNRIDEEIMKMGGGARNEPNKYPMEGLEYGLDTEEACEEGWRHNKQT
ncbi:hypothetical protein Ancab_014974 [Ancistrocladus abbreviatus]